MRLSFLFSFVLLSFSTLANEALTEIPFKIENGHIYLNIKVNGTDSIHVAFDTGAGGANLISERIANQLNLALGPSRSISGAGGTTRMKRTLANTISLNGYQLSNVSFLVMNLDHLSDEDVVMDGVIGQGIFNQYAVEINYDEQVVRLYEFGTFKEPEGYDKIDIKLRPFGIPVITSSITLPSGESLTGEYLVDTGAALAFSFNTPFSKENGLYSKFNSTYPYESTGATASKFVSEIGLLPNAKLLNQSFSDMAIRISRGTSGASGFDVVQGIIGLEILKRFNTFYDYSNKVMYLKPSHHFKESFSINHSGLKVRKEKGAMHVQSVFEGSAAAKKGIKVGDYIKSVDGKSHFTRTEFQDYFQNAKKAVVLEVIRNDKLINISMLPQAMIE